MTIIVDTSVIIAVLTNEKNKKALIKITSGADLATPYSLHWEICNAFTAMFKRNKIELKQAQTAIKYYYKIPVRFTDVNLSNVLSIAHTHNIYAYDAYFIECAKNLNAPLLTLDKELKSVAEKLNIKTFEVS